MKKLLFVFNVIAFLGINSCTSQIKNASTNSDEIVELSFPTAEGFGKYTRGGRGGSVRIVTNLNDAGEGSFRKAAEAKEKRIIVFAVSGTIHLESKLNIKGDATIAGQTAPGDGICIADHPVSIAGDNVILRYLRFRMGDKYQNIGKVDGSGSDDALSASGRKNIIIDHCSMGWSIDEVFSVYKGDSTTLQWNLISEPLNYSYHFEKGDTDFEEHGYGGIWGGTHLTAHHNLFAHCVSRNPRFNGGRLGATEELVDFRNNVLYNWGHNSTYGGELGMYNIVNNYYKYGPSTKASVKYRIVNPTTGTDLPYGKFFVHGNYVDEAIDVTNNNVLGVHLSKDEKASDKAEVIANTAFAADKINMQSAQAAYSSVLLYVGASFKRDSLDTRIINNVKSRTGSFIDVQGGFPHGTAYIATTKAWPYLQALPALADSDKDGMPDDWEIKNKLNPNDSKDASAIILHKYYTNIEVYINSLTN